jgi:hypothetical protein
MSAAASIEYDEYGWVAFEFSLERQDVSVRKECFKGSTAEGRIRPTNADELFIARMQLVVETH